MSVSSLILDQKKEWCNIRVNNLTVDGTMTHHGSGGSGFYVEVSTYQALKDALTAGENRIHLTANMTADSNLEIPAGNFYFFVECVLSMGDFYIDMQSIAGTSIKWESISIDTGYGIIWEPTSPGSLFRNDDQTQTIELLNIGIANNGTSASTPIQNVTVFRALNSVMSGNAPSTDIILNFIDEECVLQNCILISSEIAVKGKGNVLSKCWFEQCTVVFEQNNYMKVEGCHFIDGLLTIAGTTTHGVVANCTSENSLGAFTYNDLGVTTLKSNCSF